MPKTINFPFGTNGKLMFSRCLNTSAQQVMQTQLIGVQICITGMIENIVPFTGVMPLFDNLTAMLLLYSSGWLATWFTVPPTSKES